jgi:hypothetical protein
MSVKAAARSSERKVFSLSQPHVQLVVEKVKLSLILAKNVAAAGAFV